MPNTPEINPQTPIPQEFLDWANETASDEANRLAMFEGDRGKYERAFYAGLIRAYNHLSPSAAPSAGWVRLSERLPKDEITRAARRGDSSGWEFTSLTVEGDRLFIGDEETYLIRDIPKYILESLEWLDECGISHFAAAPLQYPDTYQPFQDFPRIIPHIVRMAKSGLVGTTSEWNDFLSVLNDAIVFEPTESWEEAKALRDILKWEFATDGRKFNGDHKEVLKQIMFLAKSASKPERTPPSPPSAGSVEQSPK